MSAGATQPFASVTTTEYSPGSKKFIVDVVAPLLHKYVYPAVAPLAMTSISPEANVWSPEQFELFKTFVAVLNWVGSEIVTTSEEVHPLSSVIFNV